MGHSKGCKLKADAHTTDAKLANMVAAVAEETIHQDLQGWVFEEASQGLW